MAGGEDCGMTRLGDHLGWGVVLAPADRIRWPAEVPPTGVGIHAERHPVEMDGNSVYRG